MFSVKENTVNSPMINVKIPKGTKNVILFLQFEDEELQKGDKLIDVSKWQGKIDWLVVKNVAKVTKAYIRASYGSTTDERFVENWTKAKECGIIRGAYHYWQNMTDPKKQIDIFLKSLGDDYGELPCAIDIEDKNTTLNELEEIRQWLSVVEQKHPCIIYTGNWIFDWNKGPEWIYKYPVWMAQYTNGKCDKIGKWGYPKIWQITSKGKIPGIEGNVDLDVACDGETQPIRDWFWRGVKDEEENKPNFKVSAKVKPIKIYTAPNGSFLKEMEINWLMDVSEITADGWLKVHNDGKNDWWVKDVTNG